MHNFTSGVSVLEPGYQGHGDAKWDSQVAEGLEKMEVIHYTRKWRSHLYCAGRPRSSPWQEERGARS